MNTLGEDMYHYSNTLYVMKKTLYIFFLGGGGGVILEYRYSSREKIKSIWDMGISLGKKLRYY